MAKKGLDYELLDFGDGRKLERFGNIILDRPEVGAKGKPKLSRSVWSSRANGQYQEWSKNGGRWIALNGLPDSWECQYKGKKSTLTLELKPGKFKHIGIFPEQEKHWKFLEKEIEPGDRLLNLFGYTGMASLIGAKAGADVFHNDASHSVIKQAKKNAVLSGINTIHWVCEDALKFAKREEKRGRKYRFIIMDPPVFGRGTHGEHWKLEALLPELIKTVSALLSPGGTLILNTYSPQIGLDTMIAEMALNHLTCIASGWLSLTADSRSTLKLSKYTVTKKEI